MTLQKVSLPDAIDMLTSNLANCIYIVSIFIVSKSIGSYMSIVSICIAIIVFLIIHCSITCSLLLLTFPYKSSKI